MSPFPPDSASESVDALFNQWCNRGILSNAPSDIARLILELAAQNDRYTAASLALVSKAVNIWISPILYRTVIVRTPSAVTVFDVPHFQRHALALVLRLRRLPPSPFPRSWSLKTACPSLLQLHINRDIANSIQTLAPTDFPDHLHQLVVHGATHNQPEFMNMHIYSRLTHLAFTYDIPVHFSRYPAALALFPHLTHFACAFRVYTSDYQSEHVRIRIANLGSALDLVLRLPSLEVVVVLVEDVYSTTKTHTSEDMYHLLEDVPQMSAVKVVPLSEHGLFCSRDSPDAWDVRSGTSYWAVAERVISSRRC